MSQNIRKHIKSSAFLPDERPQVIIQPGERVCALARLAFILCLSKTAKLLFKAFWICQPPKFRSGFIKIFSD